MTTALHYSSINLAGVGKEIFGLQVAISGWIKAWFQYSQQEKFNILINDVKGWDEIKGLAAEAGLDASRLVGLDSRYARENFIQFDMIFRADPDVQNILWQRQQMQDSTFGFCGLAHAISGVEAGKVLERYCLDPSDENDAIICPSQAVRSAISSFWDQYNQYIKQRFNADFKCPVQLPVIPLGIDIERYEALGSPAKRSEQRKKLNLKDDDIVLLWVGRLSHAIKAHPLAMFQAAERAAEKTGANVHLIMVGYFVPENAGPMFQSLANDVCKKAKVTFVPHNDPRFPDGLWAAGDIFLSLVDNMQESFGLTPLEAMAAGLPRVISDWDGYRDSVTDGEDGFLVRTTQPPPGNGRALSELLLSGKEMYSGFLAKSALSVAVDQDMAANAIATLIQDKNKRKTMAEKARTRARATYGWQHIIPAYENLWKELAAKRKASTYRQLDWSSALPQAPDPFTMYASYPTVALGETNKISLAASADTINALFKNEMNILGLDMMIAPDETMQLINYVSDQTSCTINDAFEKFKGNDRAQLWRTVAWLLKLGILRLT